MRNYEKMNILGEGGSGGGAGDGGQGGAGAPPPAGGGTGDGGGNPPPAYVAPEWAKGLTVDPEILKAPMFTSVKDMNDVVKGYYHAQKMVGADKVVVPTKSSTPEEWKAYYQKAGLPATLDDYKPELPASIDNEDFKKNLINKAYELNVRPDQLAAIVAEMEANNDSIVNNYQEEQKKEQLATVDSLKKEWGGDYQRNLLQAQRVIKHFGGDDTLKAVLESPLANDGQFLRLMAKVGSSLTKEDTFSQDIVSHFGTSREDAQKKINEMFGNPKSPYFDRDHAQHKDSVAQMLRWQEIVAEKA